MLKPFHWIAVLSAASILFITPSALTHPLTIASNKYPVVQTSDPNTPVCYMQTTDGSTLNLSNLCKKKASNQTHVQIAIAEVIHQDKYIVGRVVNQSNKTVYQARVNYEVIGENGSVIKRGAIPTQPQTLSPGQTAIFETIMPSDRNVSRNVRTTFAEGQEKE